MFIANGIVTHNTGRLSSGSSRGNSFFVNFNIQNVPKVELFKYVHKDENIGYVCDNNRREYSSVGKVEIGEREFYNLKLDDGREVKVSPRTQIKIKRDGVVQYSLVSGLLSSDEVLIENE